MKFRVNLEDALELTTQKEIRYSVEKWVSVNSIGQVEQLEPWSI